MATKQNKKAEPVLRARVAPSIKDKLARYAKSCDRSESYIIRTAVTMFLKEQETKQAA